MSIIISLSPTHCSTYVLVVIDRVSCWMKWHMSTPICNHADWTVSSMSGAMILMICATVWSPCVVAVCELLQAFVKKAPNAGWDFSGIWMLFVVRKTFKAAMSSAGILSMRSRTSWPGFGKSSWGAV